MVTLNSKNNLLALIIILILIGCKREYNCKEYILSNNYTFLKTKATNQKEIQNSKIIVKRNKQIINRGKLEILQTTSKNETVLKIRFFKKDTIFKTDTIYVDFKNIRHYITESREVCFETVGTPFLKSYKIDGIKVFDGEVYLDK